MVSAETPSENMCMPHPIEWMGRRYFCPNSSGKVIQKSADKPIFRLRKATKLTSKLLRPFFGLNIENSKTCMHHRALIHPHNW